MRAPPGTTPAATVVSADPAATYLAVAAGAAEGHPLWGALIASYGLGPAMVVRLLAGLVLVAAVAVAVQHEGSPLTGWTLRALTAVFAAIVAWNLLVWATT